VYENKLYAFGGTSVGAPQWAALAALANEARGTATKSTGASGIYAAAVSAYSADFFDITTGENGADPDDYAFSGYDLVTGLGSPKANELVSALTAY
jgi:subtilase family serine protease